MTNKIVFSAVSVLMIAAPLLASAETLYRQLEVGMTGSDVGALQAYLASDVTLYPQGLVTNYFGPLTKIAVANFQTRNGLPAVGRVGPATLPVLNAKMGGGVTTNNSYAPYISGTRVDVTRNTASVIWNTNESARGVVYYSTSPISMTESGGSVVVTGSSMMTDTSYRTSQNVSIANLQPNTTYYYLIYSTDQTGDVSVSWPTTFRTTN